MDAAPDRSLIDAEDIGSSPSEALSVLTDMAHGKCPGFPPERLARQALRVSAGGDFPVAREALEALLRRVAAARRGEIRIVERPGRGRVTGWYRVRRSLEPRREYVVYLASLEPLVGSCGCADYVKASLGLCKHILVVAAARGARARHAVLRSERAPFLRWDPIRPLDGSGDWLARVTWVEEGSASRERSSAAGALFRAERGGPGRLVRTFADDPRRRLELVESLSAMSRPRSGGRGASPLAEPALVTLLAREREELGRLVHHGVKPREVARHVRSLRRSLYPYQEEGVRRFLSRGRLLLGDDMGLGKTAQAIAACHVLVRAGRVERVLVVVPASLKPQWAREWQLFSDVPVTVVDGPPEERARIYRRAARGALLVNYEQVIRDLPLLCRLAPEMVVLDEAQRIKNWATKTALSVKRLDARFRLVLTGTPMENRLDELASILEWVDETALEPRWRLAPWHSTFADGGREVTGARHLDTLRARLAPSFLRRVRKEVLAQLPARRDARVSVPMTAAQQDAHDDLIQPIARIMAQARRRPLTQAEFLRLMALFTQQRILCNGIAQRDFDEVWPGLERARRPSETLLAGLFAPKLIELRELVMALAVTQERKMVVFSQWRRMLRLAAWAVSDVLGDHRLRAVFFTGEESQRRRTQNLVDFHDDPAARVLFATDAGGVGLNLQRAASSCVNLELPWNPAVLEQRIGRIYRLGQQRPIDVYNLVADSGLEGRIAALVGDKRALFHGLFDGSSDEVRFERGGSFLSRIEQLVPAVTETSADAGEDDGEAGSGGSDSTGSVEASGAGDAARDGAMAAPRPAAAGSGMRPAVDAGVLHSLIGQIRVERLADGRLAVEAPPDSAAVLADLLRQVAGLLASPP
jgi:hypothetical protein